LPILYLSVIKYESLFKELTFFQKIGQYECKNPNFYADFTPEKNIPEKAPEES
jgi:hypothetical protein